MRAEKPRTTAEKVMAYAAEQPEGALLSATELLHLGSRAAVDQVLSRLVKHGRLFRIGRGLYTHPVKGWSHEIPPTAEKVIRQLTRRTGEILVVHPAASANALGLSAQIPVQTIYFTSGRSRKFCFGKRVVELRHAPERRLAGGETRAGGAFRALEWLGPEHAAEHVQRLRKELNPKEQKALFGLRAGAPTWLAETLTAFAPRD